MNATQKRTLRRLAQILLALLALLAVVTVVKRRSAAKAEAEAAAQAAASQVTEAGVSYTALVFDNGSATLSFAADETGKWHWADDPDFPLDNDRIERIIQLISGLSPADTITDGDTLEAYGLDSPAMTLSATAADGTALTLALGVQVAGSTDYYALINGAESPVYVLTDSLASAMSYSIYSMMDLPELPVLAESQFSSISVEGAQMTILSAFAEGGADEGAAEGGSEAAVTWRSQGANVTDNAAVQSLVSALSAMTLTRCEDYNPTDKAVSLCGFGQPAATVTVRYRNELGADCELLMTVGSATAAGDGYYVRLGGDTTIYSMATDALADVLSVAASGLTA